MKRLTALVLCFVMLISITACGNGTEEKDTSAKDSVTEALTEKQTESVTEKQTESVTEKQTESETEKQTESVTEKQTESDKPIVISCVGDSITFGYNSTDPKTCSYPYHLQEILNEKYGDKYEVKKFGYSGSSMISSCEYAYTKTKEYRNSLKSEPDIVILMLGTNDTVIIQNLGIKPSEFTKSGEEIIQKYLNLDSHPTLYIASPPHSFKGRTDVATGLTKNILPRIQKFIEKFDIKFIDVYAATEDWDEYFPDGIHPSDEGYKKLAEVMYEGIKADLED